MDLRELLRMKEPVDSREGSLTVLALLMMLYVIATFLSIAIHEILGHGLFTVLLGGEFYAVYISPGNGFASLWLPQTISSTERGIIYLAGIMVQLAIGTAVLFLVLPRIKNFLLGLFTLVFCVSMLVHSSMYLFMGYYYTGGDTIYAVNYLGVRPDAFLVLGIILAGVFVLLISMAALKFMGKFMNLEEDRARFGALTLFWFPPLLLSGVISFIYSLSFSRAELAYPLLNSVILLLFIGTALLLVPVFTEPERGTTHHIPIKSVFTVVICFMVVLAGWAGIFGLSRETAHGLLLHDPPSQAEAYYADYTVGNAVIMVYANGTVGVDIILRNRMESPSPLESKIYQTFDTRPDWERYVARTRFMLVTMFDLPRSVGENLTFSTDYETVRYLNTTDELGRKCSTHVTLADARTRQFYQTPGEQTFQPGMGIQATDITLSFVDPWAIQGGYLDAVSVFWEEGLEVVDIQAWNDVNSNIFYYDGPSMVGWYNKSPEEAPSAYKLTFNIV